MRSVLASVRREDGYDRVRNAVRSLEEQWRHGEPALERCWVEYDPGGTMSVLAALIKADLRCRFLRGRRPTVNEYLEQFPPLREASERVVSLIYEEFCLREETGEHPDAETFCERYAPWRDSLALQLKYHELLSRVVVPTAPPSRFPEPGEHFQEFAIDSLLGKGGAARVYRARNDLLGGREVALKVSANRGQEPSIMGRLDHERIVPVYSVVVQEETRLRGLIMPYRPGLPLDAVISRLKSLPCPRGARVLWEVVAEAANADSRTLDEHPGWSTFPIRATYAEGVAWIICTLAEAVAYAHERGIEHRDIKPANVLLTLHDGPQLLDFNLAHDPHAPDQAEAALRGGTLPYMAPEQLHAFIDPALWSSVGPATDLYSLGLVMHELLTGEAPEVPEPDLPLPRAIRSLLDRRADMRLSPRRLDPTLPHALEAIVLRCLSYSEADRYASALELAEDLQQFLNNKPLRHVKNPSISERLRNWSRRNGAALAATAALAVVAAPLSWRSLTPIEHRAEFQSAMAAVDSRADQQALALLRPLAVQYPNSPLVQLYYSAAQANMKDVEGAAARFKLAMKLPGADAVFVAGAREYPGVVKQFEALGNFFDGAFDPGANRRDARYLECKDLAGHALATAIQLGSTSERVQELDAVHDDEAANYPEALRKFTALIDQIERYPEILRNDCLKKSSCYLYRARVWIHIATRMLDRRPAGDLETSRSSFENALDDLNRAEPLLAHDDAKRLAMCDSFRAGTEIGLGRIAVRQGRREEALQHSRETQRVIARHSEKGQPVKSFEKHAALLEDLDRSIHELPAATLSSAR
jgi:serine/threonine protein kinase